MTEPIDVVLEQREMLVECSRSQHRDQTEIAGRFSLETARGHALIDLPVREVETGLIVLR